MDGPSPVLAGPCITPCHKATNVGNRLAMNSLYLGLSYDYISMITRFRTYLGNRLAKKGYSYELCSLFVY